MKDEALDNVQLIDSFPKTASLLLIDDYCQKACSIYYIFPFILCFLLLFSSLLIPPPVVVEDRQIPIQRDKNKNCLITSSFKGFDTKSKYLSVQLKMIPGDKIVMLHGDIELRYTLAGNEVLKSNVPLPNETIYNTSHIIPIFAVPIQGEFDNIDISMTINQLSFDVSKMFFHITYFEPKYTMFLYVTHVMLLVAMIPSFIRIFLKNIFCTKNSLSMTFEQKITAGLVLAATLAADPLYIFSAFSTTGHVLLTAVFYNIFVAYLIFYSASIFGYFYETKSYVLKYGLQYFMMIFYGIVWIVYESRLVRPQFLVYYTHVDFVKINLRDSDFFAFFGVLLLFLLYTVFIWHPHDYQRRRFLIYILINASMLIIIFIHILRCLYSEKYRYSTTRQVLPILYFIMYAILMEFLHTDSNHNDVFSDVLSFTDDIPGLIVDSISDVSSDDDYDDE